MTVNSKDDIVVRKQEEICLWIVMNLIDGRLGWVGGLDVVVLLGQYCLVIGTHFSMKT
jgi:hypothetical protein